MDSINNFENNDQQDQKCPLNKFEFKFQTPPLTEPIPPELVGMNPHNEISRQNECNLFLMKYKWSIKEFFYITLWFTFRNADWDRSI